jgi:hypothetical protein
MTVAEGGGRRAVTRKFQEVYIPSLKANYMVWPAVQILNFRIMPLQFQIVGPSSGIVSWLTYFCSQWCRLSVSRGPRTSA